MAIASGTRLRSDTGGTVVLGRLLKSGGAGSVYLLDAMPGQVAKIYHAGVEHALYERKIQTMLRLSPELPDIQDGPSRHVQIAWPLALLRDQGGRFVGFTMPAVDIDATSELELILQERQARAAQLPTGLGAKVTLAANLASVIAALHRLGHHIVDLKPVNLRFYKRALYVAMLDCDGFSIQGSGERYSAPQVTPDYLAPEFQRANLPVEGEEAQDRFALAVIVFQLLDFGLHPYSGRPTLERVPTDIPGRIAGNWYPYGQAGKAGIAPSPVSGHAAMPVELRGLFDRAFQGNARVRPSAAEWSALLVRYAQRSANLIVTCTRDRAHQHFAGMACASCARSGMIAAARAAPKPKARPQWRRPPLSPIPLAGRQARLTLPPLVVPTPAYPTPLYYPPQRPLPPPTLASRLGQGGMALLGWLWRHPRAAMILLMLTFATLHQHHPSRVSDAPIDPIGTAQATIQYPASLGDGRMHNAVLLAYLDLPGGRAAAINVKYSSGDAALDQLAVDQLQQNWVLPPEVEAHRRVWIYVSLVPR